MNREINHTKVLDYDPDWIKEYEDEKEVILNTVGEYIEGIEHIGSTSIPNLCAKPIIDIAILIDSFNDVSEIISKLKTIGYEFDEEAHNTFNPTGKSERHLLRKGSPYKYHLSIAYKDRGAFWKRMLTFRDFLRSNEEYKNKYGELKKKLIKKDPTGNNTYVGDKTDLVMEILDNAGFEK